MDAPTGLPTNGSDVMCDATPVHVRDATPVHGHAPFPIPALTSKPKRGGLRVASPFDRRRRVGAGAIGTKFSLKPLAPGAPFDPIFIYSMSL
jgi:hypothetical protein